MVYVLDIAGKPLMPTKNLFKYNLEKAKFDGKSRFTSN